MSKMEYPQEQYDYIELLVGEYQNGNRDAGAQLILEFDSFINKYFILFTEGKINFEDRDTRNFLCLYIADYETRKSLKRSRVSNEVKSEAARTLALIRSRYYSITQEDLKQELITALLTLAKRYKKKGIKKNFAGYVYNAYRFEVMRRLNYLTEDPISFCPGGLVSYNDFENITSNTEPDLTFVDITQLPYIAGDELSTNWIHGITTGEVFSDLTSFERLIIKLSYVDGLFDNEIAEKTGYHRNWILRKRHRAIEKIARSLGYDTKKDN